MKKNGYVKALAVAATFTSITAMAEPVSGTGYISYNWMDAVINKTPVRAAACPEIETDLYKDGFKVALQKSFYGSLSVIKSKWFPKDERWSGVGIGPVKNNFGIFFSDISKLSELNRERAKKLPDNFDEVNRWKVSDSAYWESQGGVSFYLGTGITPIDIGTFLVATGGWSNFLQKTGPNKVYAEMSRKKIRSIGFGVGVMGPSISVDQAFEKSNGFAYEFNLDGKAAIESFERFMAGDVTKAQELSELRDSGVTKISDLSGVRIGRSKSFGIATPFIPILSFKTSTERAYDHVEEQTVWDEKIVKDAGIYVKQRNSLIMNHKIKEARSFIGGRTTTDVPDTENVLKSEQLFGQLKFTYQSNWGQEKRLRKYIGKVKALTGLVSETCARVPSFEDSLGFNQVTLEVNWSDAYVRELIGHGKSKVSLLPKIKNMAQKFQLTSEAQKICNYQDVDQYDDNCSDSSSEKVNAIFKNLEAYSANMNKNYGVNRKEFAKNMAKFGEEVWKSPFVFKAFFEKGKKCGQEFKFEVSGLRLSRHMVEQKFASSAECSL